MKKTGLWQVKSDSSKPIKEVKQTEGREISSSKLTSERGFNVGVVQKIEEKLKALANGYSSVTEDLQLAQKILAIELILIKILENLPTKSLLNFRLLNKAWEKEATNIIMKGMRTRLAFALDLKSTVVKTKNQKLIDLNECIKNSRRFPCSSFDFSDIPLDNPNLEEFFTLHGSEVKRLELRFPQRESTKLGLLHHAPNIEELQIIGVGTRENSLTCLFPENLNSVRILPHLKSFTYCNFPCAPEIIRKSGKLEKVWIQDPSLNGIVTLASLNKIHLLKKVVVEINEENIILVEMLADGYPKIETLILRSNPRPQDSDDNGFLQRRFANALTKILHSSKETLTHVDLRFEEDIFMGVKWPKLKKVWNLSLLSEGQNSTDISTEFLCHVFPNTRKLKNFRTNVLCPSVLNSEVSLTHLEEYRLQQFENLSLDNLSSFAPNLRKLELEFVQYFHGIAQSLWTFSGLRELQIELSAGTNSCLRLDMAFTGLSEEMVWKLYKDPKYFKSMKMNKKEISRPNSSILNCPDLTCLKIVLLGRNFGRPIITPVSGEFGFKMLENLQVEILAHSDVLPTLESLKPYANLSQYSVN